MWKVNWKYFHRQVDLWQVANNLNRLLNFSIKKHWLCLTRVAHNSLSTDKPVALEFPIELEFRNVDFLGEGGKPENPEKNPRS